MIKHAVWLGARASIWAHRGYEVRGERVIVESKDAAREIVYATLGHDAVEAVVPGDIFYCTQAACDADRDGSSADASIAEIVLDGEED